MAVKSCCFNSNLKLPEETKTGYVIWDGNAYDYPYWKYRTNLKFKAISHTKATDYPSKFCETMVAVGEALRGDDGEVGLCGETDQKEAGEKLGQRGEDCPG